MHRRPARASQSGAGQRLKRCLPLDGFWNEVIEPLASTRKKQPPYAWSINRTIRRLPKSCSGRRRSRVGQKRRNTLYASIRDEFKISRHKNSQHPSQKTIGARKRTLNQKESNVSRREKLDFLTARVRSADPRRKPRGGSRTGVSGLRVTLGGVIWLKD